MIKKPKRIQRKRSKGWKMPANTVSVTRSGRHGNPFPIGCYAKLGRGGDGLMYLICWDKKDATLEYCFIETAEQAVEMFREFRWRYPLAAERIAELRGRDLACWCALDQPCHADVLLELANEGGPDAAID